MDYKTGVYVCVIYRYVCVCLCIYVYVGVSINGDPQNGWFRRGHPIKKDDLGVPPFQEPPICYQFAPIGYVHDLPGMHTSTRMFISMMYLSPGTSSSGDLCI